MLARPCIIAFALCAIAALSCSPPVTDGLQAFVGKDLTKLTMAELSEFKIRLQEIVKEKPDPNAWQVPEPRWIKAYRSGQTEWILFCLAEAVSVPGSGVVKVYGFSRDWRRTFVSEFATGYRLEPSKTEFVEPPDVPLPVLRIHVRSQGPFMVEGNTSKPAFHPESGIVLYCAFNDQGAHLIRLTIGNGKLAGNSFHGGFPAFGGPDVLKRTAKAQTADLYSDDPVRQLSAIMWLSSFHLNSKDWRKKGFARESVESSQCFEELRADPAVTERLKALQQSANPWVRDQSTFALANLARPLPPVEDPPNWN